MYLLIFLIVITLMFLTEEYEKYKKECERKKREQEFLFYIKQRENFCKENDAYYDAITHQIKKRDHSIIESELL